MGRPIARYELALPAQWESWRPGEGVARAPQIAASLADTAQAQALVRDAVVALDSNPVEGLVLLQGTWVPDRTSGEPWGDLELQLLTSSPEEPVTADTYLRTVRRKPRVRGAKILHYDAAPTETSAGPAVIVTHTVASRSTGSVVATVVWTVFPPGADECLQLSLSTPVAAYAEPLVRQGAELVNDLTVTLADA